MRAEGLARPAHLLYNVAVLYRLSVAAIVAFWLMMAALLVRTEFFPGRADSLPVPVDYVKRLVFRHELASELVLYRQRRRGDGTFHLQPKQLAPDKGRGGGADLLSTSGSFLLSLPGVPAQRVVFHGILEIDDHDNVRRIELSVSLHEHKQNPPGVTLHLEGQPEEKRWHYQITRGNETLQEGAGTPDELVNRLDPRAYGIDPRVLLPASSPGATPPVRLTAQRGKLRVGDDEIDTYVVTIHHGDTLETTVHVNQLGQILAVKTFLGFDFYDDTLSP